MNESLVMFNKLREDLSDYLFHFTKGKDAYEVLQKILCEGRLYDMSNNGYICFTETPITMLPAFFEYINKQYKIPTIIAPYGIGIRKDLLFKAGARPVIYGLPDERAELPQKMQWRFVEMNLPTYDFSWLREWRIPVKSILLKPHYIVVVTNKTDEQLLFYKIKVDGDINEIDILLDDSKVDIKQIYRGISIEEIAEYNTKERLHDYLEEQQDIIDDE